jgi:hypothetical protein
MPNSSFVPAPQLPVRIGPSTKVSANHPPPFPLHIRHTCLAYIHALCRLRTLVPHGFMFLRSWSPGIPPHHHTRLATRVHACCLRYQGCESCKSAIAPQPSRAHVRAIQSYPKAGRSHLTHRPPRTLLPTYLSCPAPFQSPVQTYSPRHPPHPVYASATPPPLSTTLTLKEIAPPTCPQ